MLRVSLALILSLVAGIAHGNGSATVIQKFDGMDTNISTGTFTTTGAWELVWFCPRPMSLSIIAPNGTVVAGISSTFKGTLYQPTGGTYYIQLSSDHPEIKAPWHLAVVDASAGTDLSQANLTGMMYNPGDPGYSVPDKILAPGTGATSNPNPMTAMNGPGPVTPFNHPATPAPQNTPATASTTQQPPAANGVIPKLSEDQARAVVLITGDNAEGTGFMVKTPDGPVVITNIHVIANNPNLKVTTNTGELVNVLSMKGASDRDLAMLSIKDDGFSYLDFNQDISHTVQPGDEVITPGNSQGGEVMLNTDGKVLGIGPERIEIDNPIYHGNSGGPVFHTKSGKVLGVVTEAEEVDTDDALDKTSFASRNSAIKSKMRYFALRLDTVTDWVPIDQQRFQNETAFLDQFHEQSRRLDAYLNTPDKSSGSNASSDADANIYQSDDRIMKAIDTYTQESSGSDTGGSIDAARDWVFSMQTIADTDMDQIQNLDNFYSFDKERAQDELDYRKALLKELDDISNDVTRIGQLPRTNSSGN